MEEANYDMNATSIEIIDYLRFRYPSCLTKPDYITLQNDFVDFLLERKKADEYFDTDADLENLLHDVVSIATGRFSPPPFPATEGNSFFYGIAEIARTFKSFLDAWDEEDWQDNIREVWTAIEFNVPEIVDSPN